MIYTILMVLVGIVVYIVSIIRNENERDETVTLGGVILFFWILLSLIPMELIGFHYNTGNGEHVGYITSVEKTGIFFKTGRAYIKSDIQSSQEDSYCVIDESVFNQLQKVAQQKDKVVIKYFSWLSAGIANCGGEGDIISSVEVIK